MQYVTLSNGVKMPILGYGVYQVTKDECERCVLDALKVGYRAIDTAQSYFNEEEVGNAIVKSGIPREEIFLTTKVWLEHYGYEEAKKSVKESMRKLKTDYIDLVLLHQPFSDAYGAYRALEELYEAGKSAQSEYPISMWTEWLILLRSTESSRWLIRSRRISTISRRSSRSGLTSTAFSSRHGHLSVRAEEARLTILLL